VASSNVKGQSEWSQPGNGAIILTNPDAPLTLANNPALTSGTSIAVVWAEGAQNGGSPVLDY
jgi:hypothetical protein